MRNSKITYILALVAAGCSTSDDVDTIGGGEPLEQIMDEELEEVDALVGETEPERAPGDYGILAVDITGSMTTIRSTGNSRCTDAKILARGAINEFFDENGEGLAVWSFTNTSSSSDDVQPTSTGYYTDRVSALNAVTSMVNCSGSTPLADAMCKSINGDGETFTLSPLPNKMVILTDGFENASNGSCDGPPGDLFTPGTWQNNVFNQALARGMRIDPRYWLSPTILQSPLSVDSMTFEGEEDEEVDPMQELQIVADAEGLSSFPSFEFAPETRVMMNCNNSTACTELQFFSDIALFTGGTFGIVTDDDTNYPVEDALDPPSGPVEGDPGWW